VKLRREALADNGTRFIRIVGSAVQATHGMID
jgi:hypothetical protein